MERYKPLFSLLKTSEKRYHPACGEFTENIYTTFEVIEVKGHKYLSRTIENDYVIVGSCQWGHTDSERIAKQYGFTL